DPSGGAIPGAKVTATNSATGVSQSIISGGDGSYSFLQLAIGKYNVSAETMGFQTFPANGVHPDVGTVYVENIKLAIGAVTEAVWVEANPVQVETSTPQLGTVVEAQQIVNLPLIGRNWIALQELQPGVVGGSDRFGTGGSTHTDFATNGG